MADFKDLYDALHTVITANTVLSPSAYVFTSNKVPVGDLDNKYWIEMQSEDTGKFRNRKGGCVRMSHDVTVRFLKSLKMRDQRTSVGAGIEIEKTIKNALNDPTVVSANAILKLARVNYTSTQRELTNTSEYMLFEVNFNIELDEAV